MLYNFLCDKITIKDRAKIAVGPCVVGDMMEFLANKKIKGALPWKWCAGPAMTGKPKVSIKAPTWFYQVKKFCLHGKSGG